MTSNTLSKIHLALTLTAALLSVGCGILSPDEAKEPPKVGGGETQGFSSTQGETPPEGDNRYAKVPIQAFQVPEGESPSNVEILWQAPTDDKVEGFVIKLGSSPEKLEGEIRLKTAEIERYNDPSFGTVFRHVIHDIPAGQPLFVAVASLVEGTPSVMSEVFELKAIK